MKICPKCGAQQPDSRILCIDCEVRLVELTDQQAMIYERQAQKKLEKLSNRFDPLQDDVFYKIIGYTALAFIPVSLLLGNFVIPKAVTFFIMAAVFFAVSAGQALLPGVMWALYKFRWDMFVYGADELQPSEMYGHFRRISTCVLFVIGLIYIGIAFHGKYTYFL